MIKNLICVDFKEMLQIEGHLKVGTCGVGRGIL